MQFGKTAGVNYFLIKISVEVQQYIHIFFQMSTCYAVKLCSVSRWIKQPAAKLVRKCQNDINDFELSYEGWNFNSGNYLFTTDTK